jgi:AcrR family transcriptional regulator
MVRSRSARAHGDVLDAALALFAERGIDATSMDAIAEASGVSKATIYKHWPDKDALCLEVLARAFGGDPASRQAQTGDLRADLIAALGQAPPADAADVRMRLMPHLLAYATRNPAFAKAWQSRVFEPPRENLARVLKGYVAQGRLRRGLSVELALAQLLGPIMYGQLLRRINIEPPPHLAERVVETFLKSHGSESSADAKGRRAGDAAGARGGVRSSPTRRR